MRVLIQRVSEARVISDGILTGSINRGLLVLVGIEEADTDADAEWLAKKISALRIFSDAEGKMNLSLQDVNGEILVVSQFTLHASYEKGNRPSFTRAAKPDKAIRLYEKLKELLAAQLQKEILSGVFGADMKVQLINDGPVTIWMDSKNKE